MASFEENDEILINHQTWNRLQETATKSGFRDGISDGRDSNFQNSFDEGYQLGMKNGFALGIYKGVLSTNENLDEALQKVSRGNCIICKDNEEKPIAQLIKLQIDKTDKVLQQSRNKYQCGTSVSLPDKLN